MSSLIALKPRAVALLRAAILFAAKDDVRFFINAVCIDPDPAAGRVRIAATDKNMLFVATAPARLYGKTAPVLLSAASLKPALSAFRAADIRRARLRFPLLDFRVARRPTAEKLPDIYRW